MDASDIIREQGTVGASIKAVADRITNSVDLEASINALGASALQVKRERDALLRALKGSVGYLLNAKIDLETGAPKRTAIDTIEGGIKMAREAIAKAEVE